jgi:hypothetical protein
MWDGASRQLGRREIRRGIAVVLTITVMLTVVVAALGSPARVRIDMSCPGSERWAIKTLTDPLAATVKYAHPVVTTVNLLAAQAPALPIKKSTLRLPSELKVYRVSARLVKAKIEGSASGDEDVHLVIADPVTGQTMIAELPKPDCAPESSSIKAPQMAEARSAFLAACGKPPTGEPRLLSGMATITGVGFFDLKHGTPQLGRAPHDRELHPVLSFTLTSPCSR